MVAAEGGEPRVLVDAINGGTYSAWSADSRTVYYKNAASGDGIWPVSVDGGTPLPIVRFNDPTRPSLRSEFAVGDRDVYFTINENESDIAIVELLGGR